MRVKVEISGHQHWREVEGTVLLWSPGVANFGSERGRLQVPTVTIHVEETNEVLTINLQDYLMGARVTVLEP